MPVYPKKKRITNGNFSKMIISWGGGCLCGDDTYKYGVTLFRAHHDLAQSNRITVAKLHDIPSMYYGYTYPEN